MKILQTEKKENSVYEILVEVSPEEYDKAAGEVFVKIRKRLPVPGFRNGKAPRKMVERVYGASVFLSDALEMLFPDVLKAIDDETSYKIVDQPQVTDVDFKEDERCVNITVTFTVYPEVTIGAYKGLSAPKQSAEVNELEVDGEIAALRLRNARIENVDRAAQDGDIVVIDFEGFIEDEAFEGGQGENYELELGSGRFIPGFEDKVCGMSIGEERSIDLTFPEQYEESLAGKPVVFKVKLHEVREKQLPDLDDDFAMDVSEFDTLAEFKADIRKRLESAKEKESDEAFESALMEKITEDMEADVPAAMVEDFMDSAMRNFGMQISAMNIDAAQYLQMMNTTPEAFRESSRASSEKRAKISLALAKIAELENIEISDEEVEKEYERAAELYGKEIDEIKQTADKEGIVHDLKLRAAAKLVVESAEIEASEGPDAKAEKKPAEKKTAAKKPASDKPAAKKKAKSAESKDTPEDAQTAENKEEA